MMELFSWSCPATITNKIISSTSLCIVHQTLLRVIESFATDTEYEPPTTRDRRRKRNGNDGPNTAKLQRIHSSITMTRTHMKVVGDHATFLGRNRATSKQWVTADYNN